MGAQDQPLRLLGAPGSPYTRKMIALLRYRRIQHAIIWGGHQNPPPGLPSPKVKLLPTFYFPTARGELEAVVDSTPIVRRLEQAYDGRSALPHDPIVAYLNDLIEDYADEWLTKAMFHYRWFHKADRENAGPLLIYWSLPTLADADAAQWASAITKRQFDRLYVVGSNEITAETIEQSYARFLDVFAHLVAQRGYVLGARPASADFAIYGQLTQLGVVEPTSAALTARFPRVRAWIDRMEDLSGLEPQDEDWMTPDAALDVCAPLLAEIGRVYAPFLLANAAAVQAGDAEFSTEIDGRAWTQPTFPYQAKCLQWLREGYAALDGSARGALGSAFERAGLLRALGG
ncbi:glutathione S-transferase N-terminal domain-containing protein [Vitreimonas sp.]|uniref:glutathione S-transferase N-terminal domain-containing protein n=1 Tax=Vitreimonas sp. TaxID=3069702 RepID=UPI002EDA5BEA